MPLPNTADSLFLDLSNLGLRSGTTVMVHSSLGKVGWTVGGPVAVIRALLEVLGHEGTLVMPAESPNVSDPSGWNDNKDRLYIKGTDTFHPYTLFYLVVIITLVIWEWYSCVNYYYEINQ